MIVLQRVSALFFIFIGALVRVVSQAVKANESITLANNKRFIFCNFFSHAEISSTIIVDGPLPC